MLFHWLLALMIVLALALWLAQAHAISACLLAALVVLQVAAAVKHAVIDRAGVLSRMLPGRG